MTLTPSTTEIIAGGPDFSPLGGSSGSCYGAGCGYTGWIKMDYTFLVGGTYSLGFGVTNALDSGFDSAFAIAGVTINDKPIEEQPVSVPEPGTLGLFGLSLLGLGFARRRRSN